jgi:NADH dehydrogenase FAD-containing subunit
MPKSILLIGGGHAMMPTVRHIREMVSASVQVTLVSDHPYLYYSGMVPEYLGGVYREEEVRLDLISLCERYGIEWVHGRATGLDVRRNEVTLGDGSVVAGDVIAFDVGSMTPGTTEESIVAKPLHRITRFAAQVDQMIASDGNHSLAIVGGGAAGVEVALNVAQRIRRIGADMRIRIVLHEANDRLLHMFPKSLSKDALRLLVDAGVKVEIGSRPVVAGGNVLKSAMGEHEHDTILWATGTKGPDFFKEGGLLTDTRGFVHTDKQLRVLGRADIFASGDSALVKGYENLARIGVHAVKQGPVLLKNIAYTVNEKGSLESFAPYPVSPIIISTGDQSAWWLAGSFWFRNRFSLGLKHHIDRKWINPWLDPAYRSVKLWDYRNATDNSRI